MGKIEDLMIVIVRTAVRDQGRSRFDRTSSARTRCVLYCERNQPCSTPQAFFGLNRAASCSRLWALLPALIGPLASDHHAVLAQAEAVAVVERRSRQKHRSSILSARVTTAKRAGLLRACRSAHRDL